MDKKECVRCGLCCLCSPCFLIALGKEQMEPISDESSWNVHLCEHLSFDGDLAKCALVHKKINIVNGICSNGCKEAKQHMLEKLRSAFLEKTSSRKFHQNTKGGPNGEA